MWAGRQQALAPETTDRRCLAGREEWAAPAGSAYGERTTPSTNPSTQGGTVRAIRISDYGGPEVLIYADVPDPAAGPGEAIVQLAASGINYMDVYGRTDLYGTGQLPAILDQQTAAE